MSKLQPPSLWSLVDNPTTLRWILAAATVLFFIGIFIPMMTLTKFVIIHSSFSIVSGLMALIRDGQILVFILVGCFSVVLPTVKIGLLFLLLKPGGQATERYKKLLSLMHEYGRWSMLDVMVVAVLIVTVKLGAIASIQIHFGLYVFGLAVLLLMIVTARVSHLNRRKDNRT